jgi:ankyrin repeat protein
MVKLLVQAGANVELGNPPPIFAAVKMQCPNIVKYFLELGVDVNCQEVVSGMTPLYEAMIPNNEKAVEMIDVLLTYARDRLNPNIVPNDKEPPLFKALKVFRYRGLAKKLIELPNEICDINIRSPLDGNTILHAAVESYTEEELRYIMDVPGVKEKYLNEKNERGETPLHLALKIGFGTGVNVLLEQEGIDLEEENGQGLTPMQVAQVDYPLALQVIQAAIDRRA